MELTIDELAQRSGMTGRNIRQWQTYGLLPPPERRGRVGIYTEDHLARINRIKELRATGFHWISFDVCLKARASTHKQICATWRPAHSLLSPARRASR